MQAVEWLEGMLRTWDGALLIVSPRPLLPRQRGQPHLGDERRRASRATTATTATICSSARNAGSAARRSSTPSRRRFLSELDYIKRNIARDATKNQAVGRLRRLIREVRVVEAGGLDLLLSKNWGQVMDEVDISEAKWGVADVEQAIKGLRNPVIRPPQLNLKLKTTLRSGNLVLRTL